MYLYWRIQQDLNCLKETLWFKDPVMVRSLMKWIKKNAKAIALAEGM